MFRVSGRILLAAAGLLAASGSWAQVGLNQADPSVVERSLPKLVEPTSRPTAPIVNEPTGPVATTASAAPRIASSIIVEGSAEVPRSIFSEAIVPYIGRDLLGAALTQLAGAVAAAARNAGYPFANAWIEPQKLSDGILRVRLDAGTLSAVRVIGAINPFADRILTKALVDGHPVRREQLERAILLVGDIPGVTVMESKYVRQDGFGILLVTINDDRASLYAQIDNRGSKEIGPIRSTLLGSLRGVLRSGDELAMISSQTPAKPAEFFFLRGRYTTPVNTDGAVLSISGSYGHAHPGAELQPLRVVGESIDAAISYAQPLLRSRRESLWASVELRGLKSDQTLLGSPLRHDRLATLTTTLNGTMHLGSGVLRGDVAMIVGLPFAGVTREGDTYASRSDGDARFVAWTYDLDWVARVTDRVSVAVASEAQVASRPLLATAEIGVGGPAFGRAYDYAERSGDNGILGSGEVRFDLGHLRRIVDRAQLYGSVDGGYVGNLRRGTGGGSLFSTAAGVRLGRGRLDGMVEIALPLNRDRFDTGNHQLRVSFRISRVF